MLEGAVKIEGCFIDGYGVFNQKEVDFRNSSHILVFGTNETGKSTLFSFLRSVLSGFQSLKKKENHYLPSKGGKHGGKITISFADENISLERYSKSDVKIIGKLSDKNFLENIKLNEYRALFAYDLDELKALSLLEKSELNEKLFSAGMSGAGNIVGSALKELEQISSEVYKQRTKGSLQVLSDNLESEIEIYEQLERENKDAQIRIAELNILEEKLELVKKTKANILEKISDIDRRDLETKLQNKYFSIQKELESFKSVKCPSSSKFLRENFLFQKIGENEKEVLQIESQLVQENLQDQIAQATKILHYLNLRQETEANYERLKHISSISEAFNAKFFMVSVGLFSFLLVGKAFLNFDFSEYFVYLSFVLLVISGYKKYFRKPDAAKFDLIEKELAEIKYQIMLVNEDLKLPELNENALTKYIINKERLLSRQTTIIENRNSLTEARRVFNSELKNIYLEFGVSDHKAFHALNEISHQVEELGKQLKEFREYCKMHSYDPSVEHSEGKQTLETDSLTRSDLNFEYSSIEQKEVQIQHEISRVKILYEELASSDELADRLQNIAFQQEKLKKLYYDWQVATVATKTLEKAVTELYSSKYREVLEKASCYFSKITSNEFEKIILGKDETEIKVKRLDGKEQTLDMLSRGTLEQLYLCLRLALSVFYGEKLKRLPMIFDDILVNFDRRRAKLAMELIAEISSFQQVILFTCHDWIKELFIETQTESSQIIEL